MSMTELYQSLLDRARALYQTEHGRVGGCLHIVLDDGNIEAENVQFCIKRAEDQGCVLCHPLAVDLLAAPESIRQMIYENVFYR